MTVACSICPLPTAQFRALSHWQEVCITVTMTELPGPAVPLEDGDRVSMVPSVAPLVEQYFVFRCGDPQDPDLAGSDEHSWVGSTHSTTGVFSPGAMHSARWVAGHGRAWQDG